MPATFPSHAAAALPIKLWRPRWFDGVALVVGSAAPDAYYALSGYATPPPTHRVAGLFWFALPVTLVLTALVRWAAPVAAAHLPVRPGVLALPDYGVLGSVRHPWFVTVWSALLGAATHLCVDGFTHAPAAAHGWGVRLVPELAAEPWPGVPWWLLAQHGTTLLGAAVAALAAVVLGRRRLLRHWHGPPPVAPRRPWLFWPVAAAVAAVYPLTWPLLPFPFSPHVQGVRMLWAAVLAVLAAVAAVRLSARVDARRSVLQAP